MYNPEMNQNSIKDRITQEAMRKKKKCLHWYGL